jgi:hypothetical protein
MKVLTRRELSCVPFLLFFLLFYKSEALSQFISPPFSPNRIEQRMGRLDRFGQGMPVQTIVN